MSIRSSNIPMLFLMIVLGSSCSNIHAHRVTPTVPAIKMTQCERESALDKHLKAECTSCEGGFQMQYFSVDEACVAKYKKKDCLLDPISLYKIVLSCSECGFHYWILHKPESKEDTQNLFALMKNIDCQTFYSLLHEKQARCGACLKQDIKR